MRTTKRSIALALMVIISSISCANASKRSMPDSGFDDFREGDKRSRKETSFDTSEFGATQTFSYTDLVDSKLKCNALVE